MSNSTGAGHKLLVSIDVEDWYHGPTVISSSDPTRSLETVLQSSKDIERSFSYIDECLSILSSAQVKATFFWVAEFAKRYPEIVKRVAAENHEIACHGLSHYSKYNPRLGKDTFTPKEFKERTQRARSILEDITGKKVIGYRAPNAYISGTIFDSLEELGFLYDSSVSVNSVYNKTSSKLAGVSTAPYYPLKGELCAGNRQRSLIEFPWSYYQIGNFKFPTSGGPFLRVFGSGIISKGLEQSLSRGHTTFYFHPTDICRESMPMKFSFKRPFLWSTNGKRVERDIRTVLSRFQNCTSTFEEVISQTTSALTHGSEPSRASL